MDKSKTNTNLTAKDWLDAALQVVAESGIKALAIEPLAKRMGISKGSFYWHFKNRRALLIELLQFWDNIEIDYQSKLAVDHKNPKVFLVELFTLLIEDDINKHVFLAISNELEDDDIRTFYEKAVDRRIKLFRDAYIALGMDRKKSNEKAIITFSIYLGLIKSISDTPKKIPKLNGSSELMKGIITLVLP